MLGDRSLPCQVDQGIRGRWGWFERRNDTPGQAPDQTSASHRSPRDAHRRRRCSIHEAGNGPDAEEQTAEAEVPKCPVHGRTMRFHQGRYGAFW